MTVRQYGYAFHASSCISNEPLGTIFLIHHGTLLKFQKNDFLITINLQLNNLPF